MMYWHPVTPDDGPPEEESHLSFGWSKNYLCAIPNKDEDGGYEYVVGAFSHRLWQWKTSLDIIHPKFYTEIDHPQ